MDFSFTDFFVIVEAYISKVIDDFEKTVKLVVENIYPNFCGIDLTLLSEEVKNIDFDVEIPVLKSGCADLMDFFEDF